MECKGTDRELRYSIYVVLLDDHVGTLPQIRRRNPKRNLSKPCVYVGLTLGRIGARFKEYAQKMRGQHGLVRDNYSVNQLLKKLDYYWRWLVVKGYAENNAFVTVRAEYKKQPLSKQRRHFDDDEIRTLLTGTPETAHWHKRLYKIMLAAALTGSRSTKATSAVV